METRFARAIFAVALTAMSSCAGSGGPSWEESPNGTTEPGRLRGPAYVTSVDAEISSGEVTLLIRGNLPTPCHTAHRSAEVEGRDVIVAVWSSYPTDRVCPAVEEPFESHVAIGEIPSGRYTVVLSGRTVLRFRVQ